MTITEAHVRRALIAWLIAAATAYLWQFVPLLPHVLRELGAST